MEAVNPSRLPRVDGAVVDSLAREFEVPRRDVERAFSEVLSAIPADADRRYAEFVTTRRVRLKLFRACLSL
jgi:hypothetical protein